MLRSSCSQIEKCDNPQMPKVIAFDSVDDESLAEIKIWRDPPAPDEWCEVRPPYL